MLSGIAFSNFAFNSILFSKEKYICQKASLELVYFSVLKIQRICFGLVDQLLRSTIF